jgi:hypothetical protein
VAGVRTGARRRALPREYWKSAAGAAQALLFCVCLGVGVGETRCLRQQERREKMVKTGFLLLDDQSRYVYTHIYIYIYFCPSHLPIPREHQEVVPCQRHPASVGVVRGRVEVGEDGGAELGKLIIFVVFVCVFLRGVMLGYIG